MTDLTKPEQDTLEYITWYIKRYGVSPTYRMMVDFLGATSNGTIQYRIKRLEQKRYIKNLGYRGIKILKEGSDK